MNQKKTGEKVSNLEFYALKFRLILGSFPKLLNIGSARLVGQKARLGSLKSKLRSITTKDSESSIFIWFIHLSSHKIFGKLTVMTCGMGGFWLFEILFEMVVYDDPHAPW